MALQGTLETFALPDVLRLLASTGKTGRLTVSGDRGTGAVEVRAGEVTGGEATGAPHASDATEVVFELLRYDDGAFVFDTDVELADGQPLDVEHLIAAAEEQLAEWREIEAVVPSLRHRVSLAAELGTDEVTVDAERWRAVVAIGSGCTVGELGDRLVLGELPVSRLVKGLLEIGLGGIDEPDPGAIEPVEAAPAAIVDDAPPPPPPPPPPPAAPVDTWTVELEPDVPPPPPPVVAAVPAEEDHFDPGAIFRQDPPPADEPDPFGANGDGDLPFFSGPVGDGERDPLADDPFGPDPFVSRAMAAAEDDGEAAELAQQLANLSPRAARAVAAAARAETDEERDAALSDVDPDEPVNRGLLLRFLSSVDE